MTASMEDRIKDGPLLPRWQKLKGRHKALSGKLFKTDLAPVLQRYDQSLIDYDKEIKDEAKLKDDIAALMKISADSAAQIADLTAELAKATVKWKLEQAKHLEPLSKFAKSGAGDVNDVNTHLNNIIDAADQYVNERKGLWDQIDGTAVENLIRYKKAQREFGGKVGAILDARSKLSSAAIGAEVDAQGIIRDYIDIADDADHPEISKDLKAFKV